jgi:hypothetical protein
MAQQTIRTNSNGTELAQPGHAGFGPFYRSSTNKTYHVDACLGNQTLEMWAAVDAIGGGSWSELDGANNPTVASGMLSCEAIMSNDGTKIYMVLVTNTAINFYEFNCTTDTWTTANTETLMGNVVTVGNEAAVTITETANGNIFVGTYHDDDRVMGKDYARVVYHRRVSGTWTKEVALDDVTAAAHHFNAKAFTSGTANETHYVWFVDVNNTWNTEIDRLQCTTLDTSWNLATVDESAAISTGPAGSYAAASNAAYASGYDNHTEYQLWWDEITGGTNSGKRHSFIEGLGDELDFSGGWGSSSSAIQDTDSDGFGKLYQSWKVYESAAVTNNRHLVRVFIDGGTDLKYDSTTADPIVWPDPNAPSSFSPTTIQTGTGDFHGITCDIFEKDDGSTVLGVVYSEADLADKLYYDEVVLYASGTDISTNAPDALVITEQQATVQANVDTDISTNAPDALAITELQATVSVGVNINTNAPDALTITEQPATVQANVDTDILANAPCLPEFGNSFSSAFSSTRDCASALILSPNSALVFVGEDKFIFPNTDALVITELLM